MNERSFVVLLVVAALAVLPASAFAQQVLTPSGALETAMKNNPRMRVALGELERADLLVEREEHRYVPLLTSDFGYRYGQSPRLSPTGLRLVESNSIVASAGIAHTLPIGTQLAASVEFGRAVRDTVELGDLGAAYDTVVTAEISQPLLRGFGRDVGEAQLRQARASKTAAEAQQLTAASALAYEVLDAYWSLWFAQRNLEIQEDALEVANQKLAEGQIRLEAGAVSPAELVPIRMEVARAEEAVVAAGAALRQQSIVLAELLGLDATAELAASPEPPRTEPTPTVAAAAELAMASSPTLIRLEASRDIARIQTEVARDEALPRLDAVGSAQVAGLGSSAGESLRELSTFNAIVLFGGLRLELPIVNKARKVDVERAEVAESIAASEIELAQQRLRGQIAALVTELQTADERLALARRTAELARENVEAQSARFDAGRATTFEIVEALTDLRQAEFRVVEIELDAARRRLALQDATGVLLSEWGIATR